MEPYSASSWPHSHSCICMRIYIHVYIHTCVYTHMLIYIHACTLICIFIHIYIYTYLFIYLCILSISLFLYSYLLGSPKGRAEGHKTWRDDDEPQPFTGHREPTAAAWQRLEARHSHGSKVDPNGVSPGPCSYKMQQIYLP